MTPQRIIESDDTFLIRGGNPLKGEVKAAGAKNAATKMMIASLLTDEPCILENFPDISDTAITEQLCRALGSEMSVENGVLTIQTQSIKETRVSSSSSRKNRIPILALGPLLVRVGEAHIPTVGGDKIGARPVDMHVLSLRALGADVQVNSDSYDATAPNGLKGAQINLHYPSVGATENTILAAVLAKGKTVINNAAVEPEIIDLIKMLQNMGAIIELGTNRKITINGVPRLYGTRYRILPDRNEIISFACLAVATSGDILVKGAIQEHIITFLNTLRKIGGAFEVKDNGIRFWRGDKLRAAHVQTDTHPGFMTDWQQPLTVLLTQSEGSSIIHETVYEDRFNYTKDLNLMGANIKVSVDCLGDLVCRFKDLNHPHSAIISGPTVLRGTELTVPDLRAGIAHIIAALVAEGESRLKGVAEIDRGYEMIDARLQNLGADLKRVK